MSTPWRNGWLARAALVAATLATAACSYAPARRGLDPYPAYHHGSYHYWPRTSIRLYSHDGSFYFRSGDLRHRYWPWPSASPFHFRDRFEDHGIFWKHKWKPHRWEPRHDRWRSWDRPRHWEFKHRKSRRHDGHRDRRRH